MSDSTIIEGPDGRLYEIPNERLVEFAVPGERVAELRRRLAGKAGDRGQAGNGQHASLPPGHASLPPGHAASPPGQPMQINPGGGVVLNFFFHGPPPGPAAASATDARSEHSVEPYHMSFDESGIPVNHTEMLWGDYIDKQGNAAVGWHSHDPVTGNAQ